jgi:hypothetical protein
VSQLGQRVNDKSFDVLYQVFGFEIRVSGKVIDQELVALG